jgi:cAMP-dependent protein kinase regulator
MAAAAAVEGLKISEEKKSYIVNKLNPILEDMVTEVLTSLPTNPVIFMRDYMEKKMVSSGGAGMDAGALQAENEALKKSIEMMEKKNVETLNLLKGLEGDKEEKEVEEEEEEDDDVDELPEDFIQKPQSKGARQSVSAEAYGMWNQKVEFTPPVYPKSDDQKGRLEGTLMKCFMFSALEAKELKVVIDAMQEVIVEAKERPIAQGDDGDFLFVIESGSLECYIKNKDTGEEKMVKKVEAGDAFGELALLYNCPRAASVEAAEKATLWKLDRNSFNAIVKDAASKKRERYEKFLSKVELLSSMGNYERSQVADALKCESFSKNDTIMKEADPGDKFYILEEGNAEAMKSGIEGAVMQYKEGDYFGELALLRNQPRAATITAKTDCKVLTLDRRSFKRLLGPLDEMLQRAAASYK